MMAHSENQGNIEKLREGNYATWKFQVKHLLISKGYFGIVSGSEKKPASTAQAAEKEGYKTRSEKAFATLVLAVSSEMVYLISGCETANEAWGKLEKHFERDTLSNKLYLKKRYFRSEMLEGESITNHLKNMKEITDRLSAIKASVSEEDQVVTLLGSLPTRFDNLVTVLEAKSDLSLESVKQALINKEQKQGQGGKSSADSALRAAGAIRVGGDRNCFKCGKPGHYKYECPYKNKHGSRTSAAGMCAKFENEDNDSDEEDLAF